jgi:hypothetical protein
MLQLIRSPRPDSAAEPQQPIRTTERDLWLLQVARPGVRRLMTLAVLEDLCWDSWDDETRGWVFAAIDKLIQALPAAAIAPYAVANDVAIDFQRLGPGPDCIEELAAMTVETPPAPADLQPALTLAELRLVIARARSEERIVSDQLKEETARAEQRAIEAAGESGIGKNAEDRARHLTLALASDQQWVYVRMQYRCAQRDLEQLQAELESRLDAQRERRLLAIERLQDGVVPTVQFLQAG